MRTCFVIAEAGVNHNGSEELALQLIDIAAECGADAVKFQTFKAELLVQKGTKTAQYQEEYAGAVDQFEMLKKLELSDATLGHLVEYCQEKKIEFLSTGFDENSIDLLLKLGAKRIKIPSGELTNLPYVAHIASKNIPIILSTGMSSLDEVNDTIEWIQRTRVECGYTEPLSKFLTLLHCTSHYPASFKSVNLRAMQTMAKEFSLPVGYSDHTAGVLISPMAVAMGAVVIEKHFTINRKLPGPDHQASLKPEELSQMIRDIRDVELSLGNGIKKPTESEIEVRKVVRRSVVLARDVKAGHTLCADDLILLRPEGGIAPKNMNDIIGKVARYDCSAGCQLQWKNLQ